MADLYVAITQNQSSDVVAPLLERAVRKSGQDCAPLRDYQMLPQSGNSRAVKVKCAERPTYLLTVSPERGVQVAGGDGSVHPINPQEGPVTAVWGMRAEHFLAGEARSGGQAAPAAKPAHRSVAAQPVTRTGFAAHAETHWNSVLWAGLLLTLLLALPLLVWFNARSTQVLGFTSADKDQLLEESQEILPEIYQHPEGWFIVRGQRGKRRVFRTLLFAYLYRNYGVKLREVR